MTHLDPEDQESIKRAQEEIKEAVAIGLVIFAIILLL
jgi:hypothetical protein